MRYVLVISNNKVPLAPTTPRRARLLLNKGKASVHRLYPFTIRLKHEPVDPVTTNLEIKIDPGSKVTGISVVQHNPKESKVVFAMNLQHRGQQIKDKLESRRNSRRSRRQRKTRYRASRFLNRTRPKGWLAPSIMHRVQTTTTWIDRLSRYCPITKGSVELVNFDIAKLKNPNIKGKGYQEGKLFNTKMREYLLYLHKHTCQYCKGASKDKYLEWEHIVPKSKGGTNSATNATLACRKCNQLKGNNKPEEFLNKIKKGIISVGGDYKKALVTNIPKVTKQKSVNARDAAVVNATKYKLGDYLSQLMEFEYHSSWLTKANRKRQNYSKDHWVDAACLGEDDVYISKSLRPYVVACTGRPGKQMCLMDKNGFPRTKAKTTSDVFGFRSGDTVLVDSPKHGKYSSRIAVRVNGYFNTVNKDGKKIGISHKYCKSLYKNDGYDYNYCVFDTATIVTSKEEARKLGGICKEQKDGSYLVLTNTKQNKVSSPP